MPASKIKRRRGIKNKGGGIGSLSTLKIGLVIGICVVGGVMMTLMSGLRDALQRQRQQYVLVHGESGAALTRRPDTATGSSGVSGNSVVERKQTDHELSLLQQAENMKDRILNDHEQRVLNAQAQIAAGGGNGGIRGGFAKRQMVSPGQEQQPPPPHDIQLSPPEQLGGPYPYKLEAPPAGYDIHASYEPLGGYRFAEYTNGDAPYQITSEIRETSDAVARARREYVKGMMQFAWKGYVDRAFGMDEIKPSSGTGDNNWGGLGIQLVDCLDTLWLMGMKDEFWQARDWVRDSLHHNIGRAVSVFETTIRSLGGLLAAYDWSGDQVFLDQAMDIGRRLGHAFDGSSTGLPYGQVNLATGQHSNIGWARGNVILSEFGSMQLENRQLDIFLKTPETAELRRKNEHVYEIMNQISPPNGLFPYYVSNNDPGGIPHFKNDHLTFGAMADSFYEYMLKVWLQGGKVEPMYREMYDKAMQGMHDELVHVSQPSGLTYIADKIGSRYDEKMDHLVCFMGGLLALGAYTDPLGLESSRAQRDLKTGRVCYMLLFMAEGVFSALSFSLPF